MYVQGLHDVSYVHYMYIFIFIYILYVYNYEYIYIYMHLSGVWLKTINPQSHWVAIPRQQREAELTARFRLGQTLTPEEKSELCSLARGDVGVEVEKPGPHPICPICIEPSDK